MSDYAVAAAGEELLFKFEDPDNPGVYLAECSVNTDRKLNIKSDIWQGWRANCVNPSNPSAPVRRVKGVDITFTGAGTTDRASFKRLLTRQVAGQTFNGKCIQDTDSDGWTITGTWVIEDLTTGGMRGEHQEFSITISVADAFAVT